MRKLAALREMLIAMNVVRAENVECWTEGIELMSSGQIISNGIKVAEMRYTVNASIEGWPHEKIPVQLLFAQIVTWLNKFDPDRHFDGLPGITADPEILDDGFADIELNITFIEPINLVLDPNGLVVIDGNKYSLGDIATDVAEAAEVPEHA